MKNAFDNKYDPAFLNIDLSNFFGNDKENNKERKTLEPANPEFREKWLKMRKYEYYQRHKDSVDKYGIIEPDMLLSDEEVKELRTYLEQKHNERMSQIEQFKQEKNNIEGPSRTLRK